jgi:hypothetical protein
LCLHLALSLRDGFDGGLWVNVCERVTYKKRGDIPGSAASDSVMSFEAALEIRVNPFAAELWLSRVAASETSPGSLLLGDENIVTDVLSSSVFVDLAVASIGILWLVVIRVLDSIFVFCCVIPIVVNLIDGSRNDRHGGQVVEIGFHMVYFRHVNASIL